MECDDLSDELKAKAKACKTPEEILALAKSEGIELTDTDLEDISGGWGYDCEYNCDTLFKGGNTRKHRR
jgi:hypothetical protein